MEWREAQELHDGCCSWLAPAQCRLASRQQVCRHAQSPAHSLPDPHGTHSVFLAIPHQGVTLRPSSHSDRLLLSIYPPLPLATCLELGALVGRL